MELPIQDTALRAGIEARLAELLELELSLYASTRDAEWQLSCYGLCEDAVLAGQFTSLAGVIDSLLEQIGDIGTQGLQTLIDSGAATLKIISRRSCYLQLYTLHRQLLSHFGALTERLSGGIGLTKAAEEAIAVHTALSEKLKVYFTNQQERGATCSFTGSEEAVMLFI